ncbi:MAG: hypothetical protein K2M37_01395 [Muribaculaceae bacterium]|nr:hypothetical protein [Muribaculaceae bacterium]
MVGDIIGGALGVAGSIFGGIRASEAMKRVKRNLEDRKRRNQDWFDRRYNEDATQRADAQRILAKTEEAIRNRNRGAAGAQAVMGGTEESMVAAKEANAKAMADAAANIAVNGERRKDSIEQMYQQRDEQLDSALNNMEMNKAHAISQAVQGVSQAGGNIAGSF